MSDRRDSFFRDDTDVWVGREFTEVRRELLVCVYICTFNFESEGSQFSLWDSCQRDWR